MQNNYRYRMLAYREWRELFDQGKLGSDQRLFFEPKGPEMLFDLSTDPHEVNNLADDPSQQARLVAMREQLTKKLKSMPDLSFFPENILYDDAMDDPVGFGQEHQERIARLIDLADLMFLPVADAREKIEGAAISEDPVERYWAATVCASFGERASELVGTIRPLLKDDDRMVRVRAAEFLGGIHKIDPREVIIEVVNDSDHPVEHLIALNAAAYFHENSTMSYPLDPANLKTVSPKSEAQRRVDYFAGEWLGKKPGKKAKPKNKAKGKEKD